MMHRLCKIKYYNNCIFYNVQQNFIAQTGDPTNTGRGGDSIWGVLYGEQARFFEDEIRPHLKHKKKGVVGMASECLVFMPAYNDACVIPAGSHPGFDVNKLCLCRYRREYEFFTVLHNYSG